MKNEPTEGSFSIAFQSHTALALTATGIFESIYRRMVKEGRKRQVSAQKPLFPTMKKKTCEE